MARSGTDALAYAKAQSKKPSRSWNNLCLMFTRTCFGVGAKQPNAKKGWENLKRRHNVTVANAAGIPAGVPVWFKTKTVNWHVVISAGNGYCYSTDVGGKGKVGYISIAKLCSSWGITLLGWSEDINDVTVYKASAGSNKPAQNKPQLVSRVSVGDLKKARFQDPPKDSTAYGPYADQVYTLETALAKTGWLAKKYVDGHYGDKTVGDGSRGYGGTTGFQRKHSGTPKPDGWLGPQELRKLFLLAGMKVTITL